MELLPACKWVSVGQIYENSDQVVIRFGDPLTIRPSKNAIETNFS